MTFSGSALKVTSPWLPNTELDSIDGGGGTNTVIYSAPYSNYTIVKQSDESYLVTSRSTAEGPDRLTNIQTLKFSDQSINLSSFKKYPNDYIRHIERSGPRGAASSV